MKFMIDPTLPLELKNQATTINGRIKYFVYALCLLERNSTFEIPLSRIKTLVDAYLNNTLSQIRVESQTEEFFIAILTGDTDNLPIPQTNEELELQKIAVGDYCNLIDVSSIQKRYDMLLAELIKLNCIDSPSKLIYEFNDVPFTVPTVEGYVLSDVNIKGVSYLNIVKSTNTTNKYKVDLMKPDTVYTIKSKTNGGTFTIDGVQYNGTTNGTFISPSNLTNKELITNNVSELMIFEGDVTNKKIPYFQNNLINSSCFGGYFCLKINNEYGMIAFDLYGLPNGVCDSVSVLKGKHFTKCSSKFFNKYDPDDYNNWNIIDGFKLDDNQKKIIQFQYTGLSFPSHINSYNFICNKFEIIDVDEFEQHPKECIIIENGILKVNIQEEKLNQEIDDKKNAFFDYIDNFLQITYQLENQTEETFSSIEHSMELNCGDTVTEIYAEDPLTGDIYDVISPNFEFIFIPN